MIISYLQVTGFLFVLFFFREAFQYSREIVEKKKGYDEYYPLGSYSYKDVVERETEIMWSHFLTLVVYTLFWPFLLLVYLFTGIGLLFAVLFGRGKKEKLA